jgi:hypothetical protein
MHWHMKSRVVWIGKGDKNTKYFHKFVAQRKQKIIIWELWDEEGRQVKKLVRWKIWGETFW